MAGTRQHRPWRKYHESPLGEGGAAGWDLTAETIPPTPRRIFKFREVPRPAPKKFGIYFPATPSWVSDQRAMSQRRSLRRLR